ncbi:site-specific DNA-methyltransferase [Haloferula sargassicola]|uniref:site-specific DNA-methyltransferase (adenine-specific) n=1 Tax=Haloferula sargassicola TaxID=490096 RepID=A0ABP9URL8_9BACT
MPKRNYRDLTREQLVELLEARDRKKFGLVWERDAIEHDRALNEDFVVLEPVAELHAGEGPFGNLIIEGDNFDALRALRTAYAGQVKCIYIDPPYNTGNRDFVYNDRFVDKDHAWRHSMWLEFMFQRLTLAKDLLAPDGAIFVSIDDNEVFHLGLLMNEVFGEEAFVASCIWQKRYSRENRECIGDAHEYLFVYSLDVDGLKKRRGLIPLGEKQSKVYKNPDDDDRGRWTSISFTAQGFRPNQMYEITAPNGKVHVPPDGRCWAKTEPEYLKLKENKRFWWGKDGNGVPRVKQFLSEVDGLVPWTWWPHDEVGHTGEAAKEIRALLGTQTAFSTPKPVRLIDRILRIATNPGDLVVDFFAGSGTTAHAVLKLNAETPDETPRRFILVSNTEATEDEAEKNLCRDVCRQRVANVVSGYGDTPGTGGNFAYLRTKRIPMNRVVRRIDHVQVWLQLQLMHFASWSEAEPVASGRLFVRSTETSMVAYLTTLSDAVLKRTAKELDGRSDATLYTWQPEAVAAHFDRPGVTILPIPQTLIDRFGLKK